MATLPATSSTSAGKWIGPLIVAFGWLLINFLYWLWHTYNILGAIDPDNHTMLSLNSSAFTASLVLAYLVGFAVMALNFMVLFGFLVPGIYKMCTEGRSKPMVWLSMPPLFVLSIICLGASLGPFIGGFFTTNVSWRYKFRNACADYETRVWLDTHYQQPSRQIAFVEYDQRKSWNMWMTPLPHRLRNPAPAYTFSSSDAALQSNVTYDTVAQTWATGGKNGTYGIGEEFAVPEFGLQGNLGNFRKSCNFDAFVKIRNTQGDTVIRSVRYSGCGSMQMCVKREVPREAAAVVVGLVIQERANRAMCCHSDSDDSDDEGYDDDYQQPFQFDDEYWEDD